MQNEMQQPHLQHESTKPSQDPDFERYIQSIYERCSSEESIPALLAAAMQLRRQAVPMHREGKAIFLDMALAFEEAGQRRKEYFAHRKVAS